MKSRKSTNKPSLRTEALEAREMFAGDLLLGGNLLADLSSDRIGGKTPVADVQVSLNDRSDATVDAKVSIEVAEKAIDPKLQEPKQEETAKLDSPKLESPKLDESKLETPKLEIPKIESPILEVIDMLPGSVLDIPLDICKLAECLPNEGRPDEKPAFSSFSLRDASGDNTDEVVFQDGALEYGFRLEGGTPADMELVLESTDLASPVEHIVKLASSEQTSSQFVNLPEDMAAGTWLGYVTATMPNGEEVASGAVELEILDTRYAPGSFQGETFQYSTLPGDGVVVLGRGGTDTLQLDGIDYADVVSFNQHTTTFDFPIMAELIDLTSKLPTGEIVADPFATLDEIELVLADELVVDRTTPSPALETPDNPTSTDVQAMFRGMLFDFIQLNDGREIYFMGIEKLEFDDIGIVDMSVTTNDPRFNDQWNLHVTDVPGAWRFTTGNEDVMLVSLDSGVLPDDRGGSLTDLDPNRLITDPGDDDDGEKYGHGHKAISVMVATPNNEEGIAGINWRSDVTVLDLYGLADTFSRDSEDLLLAAEDLSAWAEGFGGDVANAVDQTLSDLEDTMQSLGDAISGWLAGEEASENEGLASLFEDLGNLVGSVADGVVDIFTGGIEGIQQLGNLIGEAVGLGADVVEEMDTYLAEMSNSLFPLALIQVLEQANQAEQRVVLQGGIQGESWLTMLESTPWMWDILEAHQDNAFFAIAAGNGNVDIDQAFELGDEEAGESGGVARLSSQFANIAAVGALERTSTTVDGRANASAVNRASYSNFGDSLTLMAPTDSLAADLLGESIVNFNGTSCANPNLAAMSSLVWSTHTSLTGGEIREILIGTAMDLASAGKDAGTGNGLVDTESAVRRAAALGRNAELAGLGNYADMMQAVSQLPLFAGTISINVDRPVFLDQFSSKSLGASEPQEQIFSQATDAQDTEEGDSTAANEVAVVDATPAALPGDADGNGEVAFADFLRLSANFGNDQASWEDGDFDGNSQVSFGDFLLLSANFGKQERMETETERRTSPQHVAAVDSLFAELDTPNGTNALAPFA